MFVWWQLLNVCIIMLLKTSNRLMSEPDHRTTAIHLYKIATRLNKSNFIEKKIVEIFQTEFENGFAGLHNKYSQDTH